MKKLKSNNIVSLKQWKARTNLLEMAVSKGWDVKPLNLIDFRNCGYFYIYEPLVSGYSACAGFDYKSLLDVMEKGTRKYGTPSKIAHMVGSVVLHVIDEKEENRDVLENMFVGNIINFSTTETARIAISHPSGIRNFGNLIYRIDEERVIMRPMALMNQEDTILSPSDVALAVVIHILEDNKNHPDYFANVNLDSVLKRIIADYPDIESKI